MLAKSHELCTRKAFELLISREPDAKIAEACREIMGPVIHASWYTDELHDVELVDVRGVGSERDDPHRDELMAIDDVSSYSGLGYCYTAFNHFIDIRKGPGIFDDYDGYSFYRGSASHNQHEDAMEARGGWIERIYHLLGENPKVKVDELIHWYLGDNYVHVEGDDWYQDCSRAMTNYSFPGDLGKYPSVVEELKARFPLADTKGHEGKGVPFSVFMPVDNLARYHYDRYQRTHESLSLGAVLHAIQDVAVPHHAAGCLGNFHGRYEAELDQTIPAWLDDAAFADSVIGMFEAYRCDDRDLPSHLSLDDTELIPGKNWRIDMVVTWLALNAYRSYERIYHGFRNGYVFDATDARLLARNAFALCMVQIERLLEPEIISSSRSQMQD